MENYITKRPEIRRVLVLSTGHAEPSTIHYFTDDTFIATHDYGAYFYVPEDFDDVEVPDDLRIVLEFARKLNCDEVKFDSDGRFLADLPRYEW